MLLNRLRTEGFKHEYELDGLVATSPVKITYFTGYYCWVDLLLRGYMDAAGRTKTPRHAGLCCPSVDGRANVSRDDCVGLASDLVRGRTWS